MSPSSLCLREIAEKELSVSLFASFNRYQEVTRCWRKEDGKWILRDIAFTEQWDDGDYAYLVKCLRNTLCQGGAVCGAFADGALVGFASVENKPLGSHGQYLQLSSLHVSYGLRGMGIGRMLFARAAELANERGAKKLYISAHSAEESQAFYHAVGCHEAEEYDRTLHEKEPCDCQLEYILP